MAYLLLILRNYYCIKGNSGEKDVLKSGREEEEGKKDACKLNISCAKFISKLILIF